MLSALAPITKISEEKVYEAFFKTHKELLAGKQGRAVTELNRARRRVNLADFKHNEKSIRICLVVPDTPKQQVEPERILTSQDAMNLHIPWEQSLTTLDAPVGTSSSSISIKGSATQHSGQPASSTSSEPIQSARKKKKKSRRTLASKRSSLNPFAEPVDYPPTPPLVDNAPLPPLPAETHSLPPAPDIAITPPQEEIIAR